MSAEWFLKLKEYDSLEKMRGKLLKSMEEEQNRLKNLNEKRQNQLKESEELRQHISLLQQDFHDTEKKLKTCEEQASRLQDMGGDENKIQAFKKEASQLEEKLFHMLDVIEAEQTKINEIKTFLAGLEKTMQEIEVEVNEVLKGSQEELRGLEMRRDLILQELPDDFRSLLERTLKKNLALGPFTRNDNGTCYFCRYKISRLDESEIDVQRQLKTCPQCSRIFLPYGS